MSFNKLEDFTGRYGINIGQSIINAWNERNNIRTERAKNDPHPEFHLIRYSSKPESIDNESPGVLRPGGGGGHTPAQYELERPGTNGNIHRSSAVGRPSKDWECVLLWDPETRTFTLEKVDSTRTVTLESPNSVPTSVSGSGCNVNNRNGKRMAERKGKGKASPPRHPATSVINKFQGHRELEEGEIDENAETLEELNAHGEKENVGLKGLSVGSSSRRQEEVAIVKQRRPLHPPVQSMKPKITANGSPKIAEAPKLPAKPKPKAKPKASAATVTGPNGQKEKEKEILIQEHGDVVAVEHPEREELTCGQPSRQAVRRNPYPESRPFASSGLALPRLPSPTPSIHHARPTVSHVLQPPLASPYDVMQEDDVVEDVDEDLFANEIEMVLEEDEEDEDEEHSPVPVPISTLTGRPLTLTELAGGGNDTNSSDISDDDDDTSSESSD